MNVALIETSGNQRYIFATNKLRENVGASELTFRAGTEFVLGAVAKVTSQESLYSECDAKLRANLLNADEKNPPLEKNAAGKVEVITATSGKALLLVDNCETAKEIIRQVTMRALAEAPGLTVHGAISENLEDLSGVSNAVKQAHEKLERNRYRTPSQEQRFLRLPFVEPCATSGLPAREYKTISNEPDSYSAVTIAKCDHAKFGWKRIERITECVASGVRLFEGIDALIDRVEELEWLGVIHADGNGLGEIFRNFERYAEAKGREYLNKYRRFSLALDICTVNAFGFALKKLRDRFGHVAASKKGDGEKKLPIVPIVLGGDDLTIICDGRYAVLFTRDFLRQFEAETAKVDQEHNDGIIHEIAQKAFGAGRLGMCAGVAIIKPRFPFYAAYELAEALLGSAKQVRTKVKDGEEMPLPCSALDYHILYDSSGADLERIRKKLEVDSGKTRLYARPYVVTPTDNLVSAKDQDWIGKRSWAQIEKRVEAMLAKEEGDEGRHRLPRSMLHDLREGLFLGRKEADARMRLAQGRYEEQGFGKLVVKENGADSLFWKPKEDETIYETNFLDALDVVEFWR